MSFRGYLFKTFIVISKYPKNPHICFSIRNFRSPVRDSWTAWRQLKRWARAYSPQSRWVLSWLALWIKISGCDTEARKTLKQTKLSKCTLPPYLVSPPSSNSSQAEKKKEKATKKKAKIGMCTMNCKYAVGKFFFLFFEHFPNFGE